MPTKWVNWCNQADIRANHYIVTNGYWACIKNGEIKVKLEYDANNKEITVTVTDNGCSIAPEHQKKIFDRFYRVENNTHTIKGTGLGLNLVKTTIEKHHNGRVFVHSEVGKGATFGFVLPVITVEEYSMK